MNNIRYALRPASRKLSLVRSLHAVLVTVAAAAAAWTVIVLLLGRSAVASLVLAALTAGVLLVRLARARCLPLDAARHVEKLAGWREKLSTAVELEDAGTENVFYDRLRSEVEGLFTATPPAAFVRWRVRSPAIAAGVLLALAVAATLVLPDGVRGLLALRRLTERHREAARVLEAAADRLKDRSLASPDVNVLRMELVGLLDDVRRRRPTGEIDRKSARILHEMSTDNRGKTRADARNIAGELAESHVLKPMAEPIGRLDTQKLRTAVHRFVDEFARMTSEEHAEVERAFRAAAAVSADAGVSAALSEAAAAANAHDKDGLHRAMMRVATELDRTVWQAKIEDAAAVDVREVLRRVQSALAGHGEAEEKPKEARAHFFSAAAPADKVVGKGNLVLRGDVGDIREVWKRTRASDASLPELSALIDGGQTAPERTTLDNRQREYVRRYFSIDSGE